MVSLTGTCLMIPTAALLIKASAVPSGIAMENLEHWIIWRLANLRFLLIEVFQCRTCNSFQETPLHLAAANATSHCTNLLLEVHWHYLGKFRCCQSIIFPGQLWKLWLIWSRRECLMWRRPTLRATLLFMLFVKQVKSERTYNLGWRQNHYWLKPPFEIFRKLSRILRERK